MRKTILASLLLAPSLALASGYTLPNTNPRDLSMCASAVAAQRDSGATFALPAALARFRGPSVSVGGGFVNVFSDWKDPTPGATGARLGDPAEPGTASLATQFTPIPNISASWGGTLPFLGDRGFGVGISLEPFGGAIVKWPDDWAGRYRVTQVDRRVFSGVLGAGLEVIPQVRIGGGLIYYRTQETFDVKVWMQPYPAAFPPANVPPTLGAPDANAHLDLSGGAFAYDASIEVDPVKGLPLTLAIDYKHKATQDLDGDITWSNVSGFFQGPAGSLGPAGALQPLVTAKGVKQQLTIPNLLNVGAAYRLIPPLLLTATFTFDRWVVYDQDLFVMNTGANFPVPRHYGNGQTYRVGAEWDVLRMLQLRAGVQRDVSGLKTSTYSPSLPDGSSWGFSAGGTVRLGRGFALDAALFYARMDKVTATNTGLEPGQYGATTVPVPQPGTAFRGSYEPSALVYTAALSWRPQAAR